MKSLPTESHTADNEYRTRQLPSDPLTAAHTHNVLSRKGKIRNSTQTGGGGGIHVD